MLYICCQMIYMKFQTYFVCKGTEKLEDVVLLEFRAFVVPFYHVLAIIMPRKIDFVALFIVLVIVCIC